MCHDQPPPHHDIVALDPETATDLLKLLRDLEEFFDNCDESIADVLDEHFGFAPAADTYTAVTALQADRLQDAIDEYRHPYEAHAN